jgi:hypothetical protein
MQLSPVTKQRSSDLAKRGSCSSHLAPAAISALICPSERRRSHYMALDLGFYWVVGIDGAQLGKAVPISRLLAGQAGDRRHRGRLQYSRLGRSPSAPSPTGAVEGHLARLRATVHNSATRREDHYRDCRDRKLVLLTEILQDAVQYFHPTRH